MKQLMTLLMAGSFLAATPVLANEDFGSQFQGNDEMSAPTEYDQLSQDEMLMPPGDGRWGRPGHPGRPGDGRRDGGRWGRGCPPGTERRPEYRWDRRARRWVHVGWSCQRGGRHHVIESQAGEVVQ